MKVFLLVWFISTNPTTPMTWQGYEVRDGLPACEKLIADYDAGKVASIKIVPLSEEEPVFDSLTVQPPSKDDLTETFKLTMYCAATNI